MDEKKRVIALGFFDGVHIGHGTLLERTKQRAEERGAMPSVLSFDVHPDTLVFGKEVPLINSAIGREEIIRRCNEIFTSDRGNGRKLYSQLSNSGFRDVRVFSTMTDSSRFDFNGRSALFEESFAYRADAFRRRLESDPQNVQYQRDYQWIQDALEQFENQFFETNFWYCEYDYSAIGRR